MVASSASPVGATPTNGLAVGYEFVARVEAAFADGSFRLRAGEVAWLARAETRPELGETTRLRVIAAGRPMLVERVDPRPTQAASPVGPQIAPPTDLVASGVVAGAVEAFVAALAEAPRSLRRAVDPFGVAATFLSRGDSGSRSQAVAARELREFVARLGHDHEARLARAVAGSGTHVDRARGSAETLKAIALRVLATSTEPGGIDAGVRQAAADVVRVLGDVERQEVRRIMTTGFEWLPLVLPAATDLRTLRVYVARDGRGERRAPAGEGDTTRVVVALDLEDLGPVRIDVDVRSSRVGLRWTVDRADVAEWILGQHDRIEVALADAGLELSALEVGRSASDPDATAPVGRSVDLRPSSGAIDVRV